MKMQSELQKLLWKTGVREMQRVRVQLVDDSVCLFGDVSSFYLKQLAQECLIGRADGLQIDNQLRVCSTIR